MYNNVILTFLLIQVARLHKIILSCTNEKKNPEIAVAHN